MLQLQVKDVLAYRAISSLSSGSNSKTSQLRGRGKQDRQAGPAALGPRAVPAPAERSGRPGRCSPASPRAGRAPGVRQPRLTCSPGGSPSCRASPPRPRRAPGCAAARPSPPAPGAAPPARAAASRAPRTAPALKHGAQSAVSPRVPAPCGSGSGEPLGIPADRSEPWESQRKGNRPAS